MPVVQKMGQNWRVTLESLKDYKKEDLERFSRIIILVMNNY